MGGRGSKEINKAQYPLSKVFMIPRELREKVEEKKNAVGDFPGGAVVKNLPANSGDTGSSPGPGRSHMPRSN